MIEMRMVEVDYRILNTLKDKRQIRAMDLLRELGIKDYATVWRHLAKLEKYGMVKQNNKLYSIKEV